LTSDSARKRARLYDPLRWVVARAPLLPVEAYLALGTAGDAAESFWRAENGDDMPGDPLVRLALLVGAGHLAHALQAPGSVDAEARQKLLRYEIRMSTRPTPYGAFAGVALCTIGSETAIRVDAERSHWRARPDMEWLLSLLATLEQRDTVLHQLKLVANPSAFVHAGRVAVNDPMPLRPGAQPLSVRASEAVLAALEGARTPIDYRSLVEKVAAAIGAAKEQIGALLDDLVRQGVLLTNLRPPLTSLAPAAHALDVLRSLPEPPAETEQLRAALDTLAEWNRLDARSAGVRWPSVDETFARLHRTEHARLQVDSALGLAQSTFGTPVAEAAAQLAQLLFRLTPLPHGVPAIEAYRGAFEVRYGRRFVPLLELLDRRVGMGMPANHGSSTIDNRRLAIRHATLQSIALDAIAERRYEKELDDASLDRIALWDPVAEALPVSIDLCVFVLASSPQAVSDGRYRISVGPNLGARQAGRYLGRFADMLGAPACDALREAADAEYIHAPQAIWAESVYLPTRLRSANVAVRPAVRLHEIAVGVQAGVTPDRLIPLAELAVGVQDGRFRLRWRDTEVIVRAGHMLTSFHAPDVCRFLEDIAQDRVAQISAFDWGPAAGLTFVPRLVKGNLVLSPAQWRISLAILGAAADVDLHSFTASLGRFRMLWQVARYVYLTDGDNRLLLDLENADQVDLLRSELARRGDAGSVLVQEALPSPEHAWVDGSNGHYLTEFVVPLVLRPRTTRRPPLAVAATGESFARDANDSVLSRFRPPGTDWLYVKIYGPADREDAFVAVPLRDLCDRLTRAKRCSGWFFVRYSDPDPHVRLRFRGDPNHLLSDVLPELCWWCTDRMVEGAVDRFAFDTYDREVDRYGGPVGLALAEAIFCADSPAAADMLAHLGRHSAIDRLTALTVSIDALLADLGLAASERHVWYKHEVRDRQAGGREFRERKTALRSYLGEPETLSHAHPEFAKILATRQQAMLPLGRRLSELQQGRELHEDRARILRSVVHMHCNRLARAERTMEETAIGMLQRLHQSLKEAPVAATALNAVRADAG
jgi:thiopeptide-type bacteriocin biosynthesis protein